MNPLVIARNFSRQGLGLFRIQQEEAGTFSRGSDLIFKGAILLSMCGVGFSMFSMSQLQDSNKNRGLRKKP